MWLRVAETFEVFWRRIFLEHLLQSKPFHQSKSQSIGTFYIFDRPHTSLSLSLCTDLIFFKIFYYILWFTKPHIYSRLLDFSNTLESMIVYQIPLVPKFRGCHITFNKVIICTYFMLLKLIIPLNFSFGRRWWFNQTKVHPNFSWWVKYMSWSHFFHYLPQLTLFETKLFSSSNLFKVMHWIWKS